MLADQIVAAAADTTAGSNLSAVSSLSTDFGAHAAGRPGGAPQARLHSEVSLGASSSMSEDSARSVSAGVTPRPHQWLYKEYKLLEEIGSGGFGRVCKCVCRRRLFLCWGEEERSLCACQPQQD